MYLNPSILLFSITAVSPEEEQEHFDNFFEVGKTKRSTIFFRHKLQCTCIFLTSDV